MLNKILKMVCASLVFTTCGAMSPLEVDPAVSRLYEKLSEVRPTTIEQCQTIVDNLSKVTFPTVSLFRVSKEDVGFIGTPNISEAIESIGLGPCGNIVLEISPVAAACKKGKAGSVNFFAKSITISDGKIIIIVPKKTRDRAFGVTKKEAPFGSSKPKRHVERERKKGVYFKHYEFTRDVLLEEDEEMPSPERTPTPEGASDEMDDSQENSGE